MALVPDCGKTAAAAAAAGRTWYRLESRGKRSHWPRWSHDLCPEIVCWLESVAGTATWSSAAWENGPGTTVSRGKGKKDSKLEQDKIMLHVRCSIIPTQYRITAEISDVLTDKSLLRSSFICNKQNQGLNEINVKYREIFSTILSLRKCHYHVCSLFQISFCEIEMLHQGNT